MDRSREKSQSVDTANIPDIYAPLKELTRYLLPHLTFDRVDFRNEDNIRCVWKRKDGQGEQDLDIDDLSSGEKSIIILFLSLLENDINQYLSKIENLNKSSEAIILGTPQLPDRVFVVDEPELHLHPDLQARILTYIRNLTSETNIQFIIATHSPTILDQAFDDELYLLAPRSTRAEDNQLQKIASNIERLEALRQLTGNTYLVTTGRSIVCIEGDSNPTEGPSDVKLLEILYPRSTAFTLVPTGGKGEVIKTVRQLRDHLPEDSFRIKIAGLVDRDQSEKSPDGIFLLPVCMVENLLLNEEAIVEYLNSVGIIGCDAQSLSGRLNAIFTFLREKEIDYRVKRKLKARTVRISGVTKDALKAMLESEIDAIRKLLPADGEIDRIISTASSAVDQILSNRTAAKYFRGKDILKKLHTDLVAQKNISYPTFCYNLAKLVARKMTVGELLNPVFDQIEGRNDVSGK